MSWGDCLVESLICKQGQLHNLWDQGLKEMWGPSSKSRKNVPQQVPKYKVFSFNNISITYQT